MDTVPSTVSGSVWAKQLEEYVICRWSQTTDAAKTLLQRWCRYETGYSA